MTNNKLEFSIQLSTSVGATVISRLIILYGIDEDLYDLTSFGGLRIYTVYNTGRPAETSLLTILGAGDDEFFALLRIISDPVILIVSNVGQYKDVGDTPGLVLDLSITREVSYLVYGNGDIVAAEV